MLKQWSYCKIDHFMKSSTKYIDIYIDYLMCKLNKRERRAHPPRVPYKNWRSRAFSEIQA